MSEIRINIDTVKAQNPRLHAIKNQIIQARDMASSIQSRLDSRILSRNGISFGVSLVANRMHELTQNIQKLQVFIDQSAGDYLKAEQRLNAKAKSPQQRHAEFKYRQLFDQGAPKGKSSSASDGLTKAERKISEYEKQIKKLEKEMKGLKNDILNYKGDPKAGNELLLKFREGSVTNREKDPLEKLVDIQEKIEGYRDKINEEQKGIQALNQRGDIKVEKHVKGDGQYSYQTVSDSDGFYGNIGNAEAGFNFKSTDNNRDSVHGYGGKVGVSGVDAGWDTNYVDSSVKLAAAEIEARLTMEEVKFGGEAAIVKYEGKTDGIELFGFDIKFGGEFSAGSIGGRGEAKWKDGFKVKLYGAFLFGGGLSLEIDKKK
ncbi:putative nucleic acid-binding Zn-ribbon protein [Bacillus tianshenii]|uniref:Nucleic acid-binding Zn-ribbon protein n=1 Tax=Sutcliffiella tianshenii TaxID=1463404 RepID=A0ABS2NVC4_9BACI|nr:hypothetical protein [Bacillus tianshenii]MBM7618614.1 putative nucleic acid-binding Zn-ribbon protein [Bacillus tianshenii]